MQHAAAGRRRQRFFVACAPNGALAGAPRKTCTHTLAANAGGELLAAATWESVSLMSASDLRRAADEHARRGADPPSRVRHFPGVGPALLQPATHVVRPNTKLAKCAWCPEVPELLASGGGGGGWLHYCRPEGAVDSWPLPCSPGVAGWTGLAAIAWLPGRRRALVGSSASHGVLLWDSAASGGGGRAGTVSLESRKLGRADCLAALPGGNLVMGGCGSGRLVVWDLRMATSSVRGFGAASKAVLHQVDVARRVAAYYDAAAAVAASAASSAAAAARSGVRGGGGLVGGLGGGGTGGGGALEELSPFVSARLLGGGGGGGWDNSVSGLAAAVAGGAAAVAGAGAGGGGAAAASSLALGGSGCFFSQLLPCPADPRLLAFVQTNLQVGLVDCATGDVVHHTSTLAAAPPGALEAWDAANAARGAPATPAGAELGAALGIGRADDFRPACCQSAWDAGGRVLLTAGALYEQHDDAAAAAAAERDQAALPGGWRAAATGGGGGGAAPERPPPLQIPTLAAVRLGYSGGGYGGGDGGAGADGAVRHVPISHHASAVFQDRATGDLLLGTGTPLLLHVG